MVRLSACLLFLMAQSALAQAVVVTETVRAREIISAEILAISDQPARGAVTDMHRLIGQEAKVALYPGRRIFSRDFGPPALVSRNEIVPLVFHRGGLRIETEARLLERGSAGQRVRVMNLSSRATLIGTLRPDRVVEVN